MIKVLFYNNYMFYPFTKGLKSFLTAYTVSLVDLLVNLELESMLFNSGNKSLYYKITT